MKFFALFLLLAAAVFGYREVLGRRDRKSFWRGARSLMVPSLIAGAATVALLLLQLNFNGKII